jgi:hypothetical protein
MKSAKFWTERYEMGDNSGSGSRGDLLNFKVDYINSFIRDNEIKSVLDFGHGDLEVAKKIEVDSYRGIDIFDCEDSGGLDLVKCKFTEYVGEGADLVMCLDVLYHLLEDEQEYMRDSLIKMIEKSKKYIMIYAQDSTNYDFDTEYQEHLHNSKWLQYMFGRTWEDIDLVTKQTEPMTGSSAQFFVFGKK